MQCPPRSRVSRVRRCAAFLLALGLAACTADSGTQPGLVSGVSAADAPASLSISPSSATDSIGRSTQFVATVYTSRGVPIPHVQVSWHSSDSTIVSVDASGRARRRGVGHTTVTASVDSVSGTAQTTALGVPIASIVVTPNPANTTVGQTVPFTASMYDSAGNVLSGRPVVWLSTAPSVISIDTSGQATTKAVGTATISATSAGILGVASVNVTGAASNSPGTVVDLAAVASSSTSATLSFTAVGDGTGGNASYDVRYAVHPISWGSAAEVSSGTCSTPVTGPAAGATVNCTVTGLAASTNYDFQLVAFRGTLNNNAVFGSVSNVATVATPGAPVASVSSVVVSPTTVTDTVGQQYQFTATLKDSAGNVLTGRTVTWTSSATGVATVNSSGYTTSVRAGTASIAAASGGVSGHATLTVVTTTSGRTDTTAFPLTENPIAEGGNWLNGATNGLDWTDVATTGGHAIGDVVADPSHYRDPTAVLTGAWGANQQVTATVYQVNPVYGADTEVELRVRSAISAHSCTGYEVLFRTTVAGDPSGQFDMVRWNGPLEASPFWRVAKAPSTDSRTATS